MELNIATKNFHMSDTLQEYANKRWAKLERYSHHIISGELIIEKDKAISVIELNLSVKHLSITSKVKNHDIYLGINEVFKKIERQLVKYEEKFRERKRISQKTRRQ